MANLRNVGAESNSSASQSETPRESLMLCADFLRRPEVMLLEEILGDERAALYVLSLLLWMHNYHLEQIEPRWVPGVVEEVCGFVGGVGQLCNAMVEAEILIKKEDGFVVAQGLVL